MRLGRTGRRAIVIGAVILWALFISPYPRSLEGLGMPLALLLLALDLTIGAATGWLAWARTGAIDERQAALRDRAYRVAFRLVLLGVLLMIMAIFVGSVLASVGPDPFTTQTPVVFGGRWILGLLELLVMTPAAVIAWRQREPVADVTQLGRTNPRQWLPLIAVPAVAALWLVAIGAMPVRASTVRDDALHGLTVSGASCGHFTGSAEVGIGFGAQVPLDVETCWDGRHAYAFREDPQSDLTRCSVVAGQSDFARITSLSCTEHADADGTMRYTVRAKVQSLGPQVTRDIVMELDVTRDGKVLAFG